MFSKVVTQQIVVHRIVKGNGKLKAFPVFRITLVFVLHGKRNRLPIDIFNRWDGIRGWGRACAD